MDRIKVAKIDDVLLSRSPVAGSHEASPNSGLDEDSPFVRGALHVTPHHLIFSPTGGNKKGKERAKVEGDNDEIWIPHPSLSAVHRPPPNLSGSSPLTIRTRSFEVFTLLFGTRAAPAADPPSSPKKHITTPSNNDDDVFLGSVDEKGNNGPGGYGESPTGYRGGASSVTKLGERQAAELWETLKELIEGASLDQLLAFYYQPRVNAASEEAPPPDTTKTPTIKPSHPSFPTQSIAPNEWSWSVYTPEREFARMGVGMSTDNKKKPRSEAWRWTAVNSSFEFCPSYPAKLVVPSRISDVTLSYAVKYRSKGRIPALVYLHWANLGSITRSSQPMVGLKNARSIQDEKLIEAIFQSHHLHTRVDRSENAPPVYGAMATNLIIDARPTTNAIANVAKGAGTENMEYYRSCKKAYLGVDNIHVMRDSLHKVVEESEATGYLDRQALRKSGWLKHISALLDGAVLIARNVHINNSHVLVHCSDGWDRTSQLSALAQLCLDPYYRTIEGFAVLIEKDWLSFGHRFADRSGHLVRDRVAFVAVPADGISPQAAFLASVQKQFAFSSHLREISPVFHQYLDCTYQIMRQYPTRFEFNSKFLEKLHYHLYSCQYGTFLFNSERERAASSASRKTQSVWEMFGPNAPDRSTYLNPAYDPSDDDASRREISADLGVLLPDPKNVKFWYELFGRTDEEMNGKMGSANEPPEDPEVVGFVDSSKDDPVLSPVTGNAPEGIREAMGASAPSPLSRSSTLPSSASSPQLRVNGPPSRSSSPAMHQSNLGPSPGTGQIHSAVQSVFRFGGSTWNSVRKGYQEAMRDFAGATAAAPSSETAFEGGQELGGSSQIRRTETPPSVGSSQSEQRQGSWQRTPVEGSAARHSPRAVQPNLPNTRLPSLREGPVPGSSGVRKVSSGNDLIGNPWSSPPREQTSPTALSIPPIVNIPTPALPSPSVPPLPSPSLSARGSSGQDKNDPVDVRRNPWAVDDKATQAHSAAGSKGSDPLSLGSDEVTASVPKSNVEGPAGGFDPLGSDSDEGHDSSSWGSDLKALE